MNENLSEFFSLKNENENDVIIYSRHVIPNRYDILSSAENF